MTRQQAISRQCGLGISHLTIAADFGISPADVLRIDNLERARRATRRVAEPFQAPKPKDWKTARPAEDRIRRGEACRSIGCEETVERGSYCGHCAASIYAPRAA